MICGHSPNDMGRALKPRTSRRRIQGKRVLSFVASFNTHGHGGVGVTVARGFARQQKIKAPAIINVRRNSYTIDSFFLSERGMFGLTYVEFNWMQFESLRAIVNEIGSQQLFDDTIYQDWSSEEESYRPEYAFI